VSAREELASLLLPQRIAHVISRAGLSQEDFGKAIGADRPRVNAWVRGRSGVSQEYAEKIAAYASSLYRENVPADLFVTDRRTPLEVAAAQLAQTARSIEEALIALTQIAAEVVPLLERQESLVREMQSFVAELRRPPASSAGPGDSR